MNIGLYVWIFRAMLEFAPIEYRPHFPGHEETDAEALARFGAIASDIEAVCSATKQPKTCASLLVSIGTGESHFARDADVGPCHRDGGYRTRCDSSFAASSWQVHAFGLDGGGQPVTVAKLFADRRLAARIALRAAVGSLSMCRHLPDPLDRLSGLSGRCQAGLKSARERYALWRRVQAWVPQ